MLPLVRSIARIDTLVRVAIVILLSSIIIPLLPDQADAGNGLVDIEAAFSAASAAPGTAQYIDVKTKSMRLAIPVNIQLRVTNDAGQVVHAKTWSNVRLPRNNRPLTSRSGFVVPANAVNGDTYNASVTVSYSSFMLAHAPEIASLEIRTAGSQPDQPTQTPVPPTATAVPPTATALPPTATAPAPSPTATATEEPGQTESILRVNAGGSSYVDSRGLTWQADGSFSGGSGYQSDASVASTDDAPLYRSERWGNFIYEVPVANGTYDLRLMFAEVWFNQPGQRVFNVDINNQPTLTNFDILAEAPAFTALDKVVPVTVTDGTLKILVTTGSADFGKLGAFELLRSSGGDKPEAPSQSTAEPTATNTPAPSPTAVPSTATPSSPAPSTIQGMIDAAAPNSTVRVPAGTYREKIYINKPLALVADGNVVIDGENRDRWIVGQASNVTIEGFTFINSNQPQYHGGLSNDGHNNWTIRNNTFRDAGNAAIDIKQGSGHLIENNNVSRSGNVGIRVESVDGTTIRGNVTQGNNTKNLDPGWEAGGMKITGNYGGVRNMVIENNQAHDNNGPGIWIDVDGHDIEIRNNRVYDNSRAGIIYELSFGGRIHGNVVYNNGRGFDAWGFGAGILIQNSSSTEVFDNIVAWNLDGISVISQNRGEARWSNVVGNTIHDNTIIANHDGGWNTYALAWLEDWNGVLSDPASNNRGYGNRFWFSTREGPELRYRWCTEAYWTAADFSATPGGQNSRYLSESEKNEVLASAGL